MIIQMLKTELGTIDNFILKEFQEGKYYEVRQSVGCRLVQKGAAVPREDFAHFTSIKHELRG